MLGAMEGVDPNDPATTKCTPPPGRDYQQFLRLTALRGKRIGTPRAFYYDPITLPDNPGASGGLNAAQAAMMAEVIAVLEREGAVVVDPADIPSVVDRARDNNTAIQGTCVGSKATDVDCSVAAASTLVLSLILATSRTQAAGEQFGLKRDSTTDPVNLADFVRDRTAAVALGKALF
jgi:Asp-tRNA(Asn)/Glu-tRNA(Gln) amidotransferase A subunit family amidase